MQRQHVLIGLAVSLLLLAMQGCWQARHDRAAAGVARSNWQACQQLTSRIDQLRRQPLLAGLDERSGADVSRQINDAVTAIGLPAAAIRRIDPRGTTRVGNTAYSQQSTVIQLQRLELVDLVAVFTSLVGFDEGLHVTSLQLTRPVIGGAAEVIETWDAEVTLTRLIFRP